MMLKIILYTYTQSVFSGRRIEKLLHDSIRMMWLAQDQTPSYKTINRFRVNPNTDALIESLFIQFAYFLEFDAYHFKVIQIFRNMILLLYLRFNCFWNDHVCRQ